MALTLKERNLDLFALTEVVEAMYSALGVKGGREAVRLLIPQLGYCRKRTEYVLCQELGPKVKGEHPVGRETPKKGARRPLAA